MMRDKCVGIEQLIRIRPNSVPEKSSACLFVLTGDIRDVLRLRFAKFFAQIFCWTLAWLNIDLVISSFYWFSFWIFLIFHFLFN